MWPLVFALILLCARAGHGAALETTRSFQPCGAADPETPRFLLADCPSNTSYTRATLSVDINAPGFAEIRYVGDSLNVTRPGDEAGVCQGPFCVPVPTTLLHWNFAGARAQWSLAPLGFGIPFAYVLQNATEPNCTYVQVPYQVCDVQGCGVVAPDPCSGTCGADGIQDSERDDGSGVCGLGAPQCYELCCPNGTTYRVARQDPQCQLYQAIGPPLLSASITVRVQRQGFDRTLNISGGLGARILGFDGELRGFMRETVANPSKFDLPNVITRGYFAVCDSVSGSVYNSTVSITSPPTCGVVLGDRWFYIPPMMAPAYGLGARQYGESSFDVLQDLATLGCANESQFADSIPGRRLALNPASDYEAPSPCTILDMIQTGDPRAVYWLPPHYASSAFDWRLDGAVVSMHVDTHVRIVRDAFLVDVDLSTEAMPYSPAISPGYVDEELSRCYTTGNNPRVPSEVPGFLSPMVCNPATPAPRVQEYTVTYVCDPAVVLNHTTDTVLVPNGVCIATSVDYFISTTDMNSASRVCNIYLDPGLDDPYPVMCIFGAVVPTPPASCSVFSFGCNFKGEDGGAWYRCVSFWILLAVFLAAVGALAWYGSVKSEKARLDARRRRQVESKQ